MSDENDNPRAILEDLLEQLEKNLAELGRLMVGLTDQSPELAGRKWALTLDEGMRRVLPKAQRLRAAFAERELTDLIPDLLEITEDVRELYSATTQEDLGAEMDEVEADDDAAALPHLREIDHCFEDGKTTAALLRNGATNAIPPSQGAQSMPQTNDEKAGGSGADTVAIQELLLAISDMRAGPPAAAPGGSDVIKRLRTSVAALGLPELDGDAWLNARPLELRRQITESLRRHFDYVEHDGVRTYFRTDRGQAAVGPATDGRSFAAQRGRGLFNTQQLQTTAKLILQLIDELPALSPTPPNLTRFSSEAMRERIRTVLDEIVRLASAPLGVLAVEITAQYRWLLLAVADWLEASAISSPVKLRDVAVNKIPSIGDSRSRGEPDEWVSAVSTEEMRVLVNALLDALQHIWKIASDDADDAGRDAARAEQAFILLGASALQLQRELDRLGTSPEEQEITFIGVTEPQVSIGQFVRWAMNISAAFAASADATARLRPHELRVLHAELGAIAELADKLSEAADQPPLRVQVAGARRQLLEVKSLIEEAKDSVYELLPPEPKAPVKKTAAS